MYQDINSYPKGYVEFDKLENLTELAIQNGVIDRKYNQLGYLWRLCKILTGIYTNKENRLTLDRDEQVEEIRRSGRDPYKQRLYKYDLYQESININKEIVCYYENKSYPVLIASHIKPYVKCEENERFDVNNGLLLSKNLDNLFDSGWISFGNDGTVICSKNLDKRIKLELEKYKLEKKYLNEARLKYLEYHRNCVFDINKEYNYQI